MKEFVLFKIDYFTWHYSQGVKDMMSIWRNVLWVISNFFSVKDLVKSLFTPWKMLGEEKTKSGMEITIGKKIQIKIEFIRFLSLSESQSDMRL